MIRALLGALVLALCLGWGLWQRGQAIEARAEAGAARADLAAATLVIDQAREAARVHRAHLARAEAEAARWRVLVNEIELMEGGDADLSDYLRGVAGRLWR